MLKKLFLLFISLLVSLLLCLDAMASQQEAITAFNGKDYKTAKKLFKQNDDEAKSQYYLALIAIEEGELEDAEEWLESSIELEPNNADYQYQYGWVNMRLAATSSMLSAPFYASTAKDSLKKAIKIDPEHKEAMVALAQFYIFAPSIAGGSLEKGQKLQSKLATIDKLEADLLNIQIARKQEDTEKQISIAKQIVSDHSTSARALLSAGYALQSNEDYEAAFKVFKTASQLTPVDEKDTSVDNALYQVGKTAVLLKAHYDEAKQALNALIRSAVDESTQKFALIKWAQFRLAQIVAETGDKKQALQLIKLAGDGNDDDDLSKELKALRKQLS